VTTTSDKPITRLLGLLNKHRKFVWTAVIIGSYALLGFFLAPWLVKKYAVETYGEMYAAELRINEVEINPFVLSLRVVELELLDPVGDPVVRAAILASDASLDKRITLGSNQAVEKKSDENIQLRVTLSVGSESGGEENDAQSEQSN